MSYMIEEVPDGEGLEERLLRRRMSEEHKHAQARLALSYLLDGTGARSTRERRTCVTDPAQECHSILKARFFKE